MKQLAIIIVFLFLLISTNSCKSSSLLKDTPPLGTPASWGLARSVGMLVFETDPENRLASTAFSISTTFQITAGHTCVEVLQRALTSHIEPLVDIYYINADDVKETIKALVLWVDPVSDLCLLYNDSNKMVPLKIGMSMEVPRLSKVYLLGSPLGIYPILIDCYLSSHLKDEVFYGAGPDDRLFISCMGSPGDSGAPIINENGEVIGIVSQALPYHPSLPLALGMRVVASEDLLQVLTAHGIK